MDSKYNSPVPPRNENALSPVLPRETPPTPSTAPPPSSVLQATPSRPDMCSPQATPLSENNLTSDEDAAEETHHSMPDDVMPPNVNAANQGPEQMSLAVQETGDNQNSSSACYQSGFHKDNKTDSSMIMAEVTYSNKTNLNNNIVISDCQRPKPKDVHYVDDDYKREGPRVPTRHLRVMVIGPPGSGKTSVLQRLMGKDPESVDISNIQYVVVNLCEDGWNEVSEEEFHRKMETEATENIFLHVWDCGGQPFYLNALSPFLSAATAYLLVLNADQPLDDKLNECGEAVEMSYEELLWQWMAAIDSYVPRNLEFLSFKPKPRIIIVGTHTSSQASAIDGIVERFKGAAFCDLLHHEVMLVDYKQNKGDFQGIRRAIQDVADANIVYIPEKWISFHGRLPKNNPVIGSKQLLATAKECNDLRSLLHLYHELGVFVSCPKNYIIIANPKWLVEKLGSLLCHKKQLLKRGGKYNAVNLFCDFGILVEDLCKAVFSASDSQIVIHILKKFFVAAKVIISLSGNIYNGEEGYFVPAMLTIKQKPEEMKFHLATGDLYIQIPRLKYLPSGLFLQLIVALAKRESFTPDFNTASYNCVRFTYHRCCYIATVSAESNSRIKLTFGREEMIRDSSEKSFYHFCQEVFELVTEEMQNLPLLPHGYMVQPALKCNCCAKPHYMAITLGQELERDKREKRCSKSKCGVIDPNSKLWLKRESREIHVDDRTPGRILSLMNQILKEERSVDDLVKSLDIPGYDHSNQKMKQSFLEYLKVWVEADTEEAAHTILYHLKCLNFNRDYIHRIEQPMLTTPPIEEDHIIENPRLALPTVSVNLVYIYIDDEDNRRLVYEQPDSDSKESQDKPTLGPDHLSELFETVKGAKEKWRNIGTSIGFSHGELTAITNTNGLTDDTGYFQELLKRWLNRAPPHYTFPRVEELLLTLRLCEVGMHRTAYDLERDFLARLLYKFKK